AKATVTPITRLKRGPKPRVPDVGLLQAIQDDLESSPFTAEGHRKVWARLRILRDIRGSRERVRIDDIFHRRIRFWVTVRVPSYAPSVAFPGPPHEVNCFPLLTMVRHDLKACRLLARPHSQRYTCVSPSTLICVNAENRPPAEVNLFMIQIGIAPKHESFAKQTSGCGFFEAPEFVCEPHQDWVAGSSRADRLKSRVWS
ncbi:hypothetical protein ACLKMY_40880, partial [Paraburkholderia mimosarum]